MRTTSEKRRIFAPPCQQHPAGQAAVVLPAVAALAAIMQRWGYLPRQRDTGSFVCRQITGGSGYSLHAYGPFLVYTFWNGTRITVAVAIDINWTDNPYGSRLVTDMPRGMVEEILALRTNNGVEVWRWGGYFSGNKDAMHYELNASPDELATGINVPADPPKPRQETDMPTAPASIIDRDAVEHHFVLGLPENGERGIWHKQGDGEWKRVPGGILTSAPAAVALEDGTIVLAARGTDLSAWLNQRETDGSWSGWSDLDGVLTSAPSLAADGNAVILTGRGQDGAAWRRRIVGGVPGEWESLGGLLSA